MIEPTEVEKYGPRRGNAGERFASDWRLLLGVSQGLVLQTMHPVIGGGVGAYSTYKTDPYGRAVRSIWPVLAMVVFEDSSGYGADMRELHRGIGGTDQKGRRYHAWNPEAAFWVCATAAHASIAMQERFGKWPTDDERREVFHAWRRAASDFGVPESQLPATYAEYQAWFDMIARERLENHPTTREVLEAIRQPAAPPRVPRLLWMPLRPLIGFVVMLVLRGTLPTPARELLELPWTEKDERRLRRLARMVRVVSALMPRRLRNINGLIIAKFETQIRAHVAHGAELGIAPSLSATKTPARDPESQLR